MHQQGYRVHLLRRPSSPEQRIADLDVAQHLGDLQDPDSLHNAAQAVAEESPGRAPWLIHNAAVISYRRQDAELQQAVNVEGTRSALLAARAAGFERVLYVSSVVAVGFSVNGGPIDEGSDWNGAQLGSAYAETKHRAEQLALGFRDDLDVRVINPGAIYGAGSQEANTSKFIAAASKGTLGPLIPPGSMGVVGVQDVARGARFALERGQPGRRYILVDRSYTLAELFELVAGALNKAGAPVGVPTLRVPAALWRGLVLGAGLVERLRSPRDLHAQALNMLGTCWNLSADRARSELGWSTQSFESVLDAVVRDLELGPAC